MNNPTPKHRLTIIIATYRRNRLLAECLASVSRQRKKGFRDFDVIVVDDGGGKTSTAKRIADPSYVRFLDLPENGGQPAAQAKAAGLNIDYFPTNFVVSGGLWYIDYECNAYMDEWSFDNWGVKYWSHTPELEACLSGEEMK